MTRTSYWEDPATSLPGANSHEAFGPDTSGEDWTPSLHGPGPGDEPEIKQVGDTGLNRKAMP